jgi:type I restriction enzyme M protein
MLDSETKRRIDSARDILVGKVPDPKAQVEQITTALIYKFMDDMDRDSELLGGKASFIVEELEPYKWANLMSKASSGFQRLETYISALEQFSQSPHIPEIFRKIFKNAFLPYRDPETLNLFLKEIDWFDYDHSENLGNAFEYLLNIMSSQGDAGQFRTPRHIIDFIIDIVKPKKGERILDPACGTAGFLISAYKYIKEHEKNLDFKERKELMENIIGYDISPDMVRLSLVNMYLHQFPQPKVFEHDTLTSEDRWRESFDVILANPPFMTPKGGIRPHRRFRVQAKRSEVLFVDYIFEHLAVNGRAGIIVPEGIIFQSATAYKALRKILIEEKFLWAVVSLPAGIFQPYSGVKTSVLLLDKSIAKQQDSIIFIKVANDGFDLGAQRREHNKNDLPRALELLEQFQRGETIDDPIALVVSKQKIAQSGDYNLTGDRYKETIKYNTVYPMVKLGEVCETTSGGTPLKSKTEFYENGTIPWLRSGEVAQGEVTNSEMFITEEGLKNSSAKILPVDTVLVAMYGATAGQVGILKFATATNQAICGILPNEYFIPKFLFYIIKSQKDKLINLAGGGAQPNISQAIIKNIEIPLPPLEVQKAIIEEIEQYQKVIDGAKQVVEQFETKIKTKIAKIWGEAL